MKKSLMTAVLMLSVAAWAEPSEGPGPGGRSANFELNQVNRISSALNLDEAGTAKVKATLDTFAPQLKSIHQQMRESFKIIRAGSEGDSAALSQLEGAITQLKGLRSQIEQIHEQLFTQLSLGLSPQQKAKLLVTLLPRFEHHRHGHWFHGQARPSN
jgi:hypothetical protein